MLRKLVILGLAAILVSTLAAVAAVRSSSDEAEAQVTAFQMNYLCVELTTSLYKGSFTGICPPNHRLLTLPDDYPISLCASAYDSFVRAPQPNGNCPPATSIRIELPSNTVVNLCYFWATGRLGIPSPYPFGGCSPGALRVTFPFEIGADFYQTLGNVDLDVPASAGLLSNDFGPGLMITAFDAASANGGEVNVNPDGSFTYIPPMPDPNAFTGADTFTYTVEDSGGVSEVVTVTILVLNPVVWFVDADATEEGDGRRLTPLNDLQLLNDDGIDPDNPGDVIYLFEAAMPYAGGFVLEDSQTLVGQEVSVVEVIESELGAGASLQGATATVVPPFAVFPETDPTLDIPLLTNEFTGLEMLDDTTAAGLTITAELGRGVTASGASELLLDRVSVTGGQEGIGLPGVEIFAAEMRIIDSEIFGGAVSTTAPATGGSSLQGEMIPTFGPSGGDAILAFDSTLFVSGTLAAGGAGSDAIEAGGQGGDGIRSEFGLAAITGSSLQGVNGAVAEITVIDSQISGGIGGEAFGASEGFRQGSSLLGNGSPPILAFGGAAGIGIFVSNGLIPLSNGMPSLQGLDAGMDLLVSNSQITGGVGGAGIDFGGLGGAGVVSLGLHTTIDQGSTVSGGTGGAGALISTGAGGHGIFVAGTVEVLTSLGRDITLQGPGPTQPGSVSVDGSTVAGGSSGAGNASTAPTGGAGILALGGGAPPLESESALTGNGSPQIAITVTNSTVSGADGVSRPGLIGGAGADGISADSHDLLVEAGSVVNGGAGGGGDAGGNGGDGINADFAPVTINDATVNGGAGGFSDNATGGFGGDGIDAKGDFDVPLIVTGSNINGGAGGASLTMTPGFGGLGIDSTNNDTNISGSTITGGTPGADGSGRGGPSGSSAVFLSILVNETFAAILANNTLVGSLGDPGQAASLTVSVSAGSVCIDANGNIPTGAFSMTNIAGTMGITQASDAALSDDNNGVTVNATGLSFDCSTTP